MGARSASKIKLRNATYKCDVCGRRLMSAKALKFHQECVHHVTKTKKIRAAAKQTLTTKNRIQKRKNVKRSKVTKVTVSKLKSAPPKLKLQTDSHVTFATPSDPDDMPNVEYECPICLQIFPVYFAAHIHIQKSHSLNSIGETILPNSPHLIEPVLKELCMKCDKRISSLEPHYCVKTELENVGLGPTMSYVCSGCRQHFDSLTLFDLHLAGMHWDGVESMFFPNLNEFLTWKEEMEKQTKVKYAILDKWKSKITYHCTFQPYEGNAWDNTTSFFCPSNVTVHEFSKGLHIHFYKDHHGHAFKGYLMRKQYKKFSLTTLLQNANGYTQIDNLAVDENDLYLQFKKVMDNIILNAAKINIDTLKIMIGKALDMTSVLTNYKEDPEPDSTFTKMIIDDKLTWVLGELENNQGQKGEVSLGANKSKNRLVTKQLTKKHERAINVHPSPNMTKTPSKILDPSNMTYSSLNIIHPHANILQSVLEATKTKISNYFTVAPAISETIEKLDSKHEFDSEPNLDEHGSSNMPSATDATIKDSMTGPMEEKQQIDPNYSNKPPSFSDSYKDFINRYSKIKSPSQSMRKKKKTDDISVKTAGTPSISIGFPLEIDAFGSEHNI